jgi:hypothetical protein
MVFATVGPTIATSGDLNAACRVKCPRYGCAGPAERAGGGPTHSVEYNTKTDRRLLSIYDITSIGFVNYCIAILLIFGLVTYHRVLTKVATVISGYWMIGAPAAGEKERITRCTYCNCIKGIGPPDGSATFSIQKVASSRTALAF